MTLTQDERDRIENARTRDHEPGYRPSLHEHLTGTREPYRAYSFEEALAVRRRLAGRDELAGHDLQQLVDSDRLTAYTTALADQDLQRGDLGPAFITALGDHGSIRAANAHMIEIFGRTASPSYAHRLKKSWALLRQGRLAEAERRRAAHLDEPRSGFSRP